MHESKLICPLLNLTPKISSFNNNESNENDVDDQAESRKQEDKKTSSGFSMGYLFLIAILMIAFAVFYLVIRNPERSEIFRNMIKFRSRANVRYSRVS